MDNIWGGNFRCVCVCVCFVYTDKYGGVYGLGGQEYAYHHNEDESSFQLVDTTKTVRPPYQRNKMRLSQVSQ